MKVMKFGGTSVGKPERMHQVSQLITKDAEPTIVVLSALSGTTNALVEISNNLSQGERGLAKQHIDKLEAHYRSFVIDLLKQETTREELTEYLRDVSLHSSMQRQIDFISSPDAVSTDFVGSRHACVIDAEATIVDGKHVVLYVWYDNEFGYSCQVIRVVQHITGVEYPQFPAQ